MDYNCGIRADLWQLLKDGLKMVLQEKIYFIAGIGTDIGKTFLVEKLCRALRDQKIEVKAVKPVASGFNDGDPNSDSAKILAALGLEISRNNLNEVTPWRFSEAISPHLAAKKLGQKIDFLEVKNFCQKKISEAKNCDQFLFIEAAGGVMTPLNEEKTFLDLAAELEIPLLLVSANYLGSISHTLCAVAALKSKNITIEKIIINDHFPLSEKNSQTDILSVVESIQNFSKVETALIASVIDPRS